MSFYQTSITIDASPDIVWKLLAAVVAWPDWLQTVTSVDALDDKALAIGHRFKVLQPGLRPATWTVSAIEPGRRFEWQARSPGMRMIADHRIEALAPAATTALLRFEFRGLVGSLLGRLFASTTKRFVDKEAAALKEAAEKIWKQHTRFAQ